MNSSLVRRVVWFSALYDLLVTWPFATPWTARWLSHQLAALHASWGFTGSPPSLDDPTALLFANMMGSIVVIWSVLRLHSPTAENGLADACGRALFSSWQLFALTHGGSLIVLPFFIAEVAWGLAQFAVVAPAAWRARPST
jgi:hypothetical protein